MFSKRDQSPKRSVAGKLSLSEIVSKSDLHSDGFVVLKDFLDIPREVLTEIVEKQSKRAQPIFNAVSNGSTQKGDGKRLQCKLAQSRIMAPFIKELNRLTCQLSKHKPSSWVVIKSEIGASRQPPHADYTPVPGTSDQDVSLALLVALENDTALQVWPGAIRLMDDISDIQQRLPIQEKTLHLSQGDAVLFRGDLIHAGSAYMTKPNRRLHCFLDSDASKRYANTTWLIDDKEVPDSIRNIIN
jgi:ectoine hydroxylase-related dioxygenase (phytanoyl-CoA dioxygenase family)